MNDKITSLHSTFSVNGEVSDDDTRFISVTIDVLHAGLNFNESFFSKEVVDSCIDSIKNTPILGFVRYNEKSNENDFKGHERILTRTSNGITDRYVGSAYGLIPESCNPRWYTKVCQDGEEREFLQVDALLWTKFSDCTNIMERDLEKSESMELEVSSIEGDEDEKGIFHFTKFRFNGCCLLGDDVPPAMTGANVKVNDVQFSFNDFMNNIQSELNDKFEAFSKLVNKISEQGGVSDMPNSNSNYSQTVLEQFEDIAAMVSGLEKTTNRWGDSVPRYSLVDIQDNEVIVVDGKDNYRYYGFPFTVNGDAPVIDYTNGGKRKKVRYEDYEENAQAPAGAFDFGSYIASIEESSFEKISEFETKLEEATSKVAEVEQAKDAVEAEYAQVKAEYDEIKPKYDEYVQAETQREADELSAQKDAKFAEYEDVLGENADFAALKEKKDEMSVDDIEKECAVMFVKASRSNKINFSKTDINSAVVGVFNDDDGSDENYVHTKYGNIRRSR